MGQISQCLLWHFAACQIFSPCLMPLHIILYWGLPSKNNLSCLIMKLIQASFRVGSPTKHVRIDHWLERPVIRNILESHLSKVSYTRKTNECEAFSIFLHFNKNTHYHNPREENYLCPVTVRNDMRLLLWVKHDDVLRRVTILLEQLNILAICFCWRNCSSVVFVVFFWIVSLCVSVMIRLSKETTCETYS